MIDDDSDSSSDVDSDNDSVCDSVCGVVYDLAGTGGKAKSTVDGKNSAMKRFNDFLMTKNMKPWDKLTQSELCKKTFFWPGPKRPIFRTLSIICIKN